MGSGADPHEVIDLLSDDEEPSEEHNGPDNRVAEHAPVKDINDFFALEEYAGDDLGMLDLEWPGRLPDINVPPDEPATGPDPMPATPDGDLDEGDLLTAAACLQLVVNVLPDISVNHVLQLIQDQTQDATRTPAASEQLIAQLLDGGDYPKEQDEESSRKRKRERSSSMFEHDDANQPSTEYTRETNELLKDEFPQVPVRHIEHVVREQKTLYKAYAVIENQLYGYPELAPFTKLNKARLKRGIEFSLVSRGSQLPKELHAAKIKCEKEAVKRRRAEEAKKEEDNNLHQARLNGGMGECQCCFDEFPANRMVGCGEATVHHFCMTCVKSYVESEMGSSRCRPICFADPNCGGSFRRTQLQQCLTEITFNRLEHMQQQQDLAAAGLDFLSECPFCDFKAECPPVEEDKEFRCLNPKCRKTSCRLCQKETHIPLSCEESRKDEKITVRHIVEEAMTAALIRNCNKCKHPFIKELGCNKMTCTHCGNVQCYVCSKDVKDYSHFHDHRRQSGCPLHDNVEDRHEKEVKKAAEEAMSKVRAENPDISEEDLMVKVSDHVKQAEGTRVGQAQVRHEVFPWHMADGRLLAQPPPLLPLEQYVPDALRMQFPLPIIVPEQHLFFDQEEYMQPPAQDPFVPGLWPEEVQPADVALFQPMPHPPLPFGYPAPLGVMMPARARFQRQAQQHIQLAQQRIQQAQQQAQVAPQQAQPVRQHLQAQQVQQAQQQAQAQQQPQFAARPAHPVNAFTIPRLDPAHRANPFGRLPQVPPGRAQQAQQQAQAQIGVRARIAAERDRMIAARDRLLAPRHGNNAGAQHFGP